ncbi:hypothetical protein ACJIZ3_012633 [Penstemon smallii]|uniref:Dof zinc finger protein n=1 Tax=Penstemon smallii TaxID=265156 RepID=A0ABD3UP58_9LAMI
MMDSSSAQQHHQEVDTQTLESMLVCAKTSSASAQEKKPRPVAEQALKCPRCDSTNTKFCYYNNYSLSQPRYFCKSCRRYWTKGGTLRNVPVGGGCRRNNSKRSSSSSSSKPSRSSSTQDQPLITTNIPLQHSYDCNDLSLAFARLHQQKQITNSNSAGGQLGLFDDHNNLSLMLPHGDLGNNNPINGFLESNPQSGFYFNGSHELGMGQFEDYYSCATTAATSAAATTTVKQEMSNVVGREASSHVLFGFPYSTGDGLNWINNGINGASNSIWHGLLNSPLM